MADGDAAVLELNKRGEILRTEERRRGINSGGKYKGAASTVLFATARPLKYAMRLNIGDNYGFTGKNMIQFIFFWFDYSKFPN